MPTKEQIAILRTVSTEFGSALNAEVTQIKAMIDDRLSELDATYQDAKNSISERLVQLEQKIGRASELEDALNIISEDQQILTKRIADLPLPLTLEEVLENVESGTAIEAVKNRIEEIKEIASDQFELTIVRLEKRFGESRSELQKEVEALRSEIQALADQETNVEIDMDALSERLGKCDDFACQMKSHVEVLMDEYTAEQKSAVQAICIEQFEKSLGTTNELVKAHLEAIPRPKDGRDGIGIDCDYWERDKIYRADSVVTAHMGQFYVAKVDTTSEPGKSEDWVRLTNSGMRWCGVKPDESTHKEGDLFVDEGSLFLVINGKAKLIVKRGKNGRNGKDGKDGANGKDAPYVVADQFVGTKRVLVYSNGWEDEQEVPLLVEAKDTAERAEKAAFFLEQEYQQPDDQSVRIRWYRGVYKKSDSYSAGDLVKFEGTLYLAVKKPKRGVLSEPEWILFGGGSPSGMGGSGPFSQAAISAAIDTALAEKDLLTWNGDYEHGELVPMYTIVNDHGWLMISNKETSDPAAPALTGPLGNYGEGLPTDSTGWTQTVESLRFLWMGAEYTLPFDYVISQVAMFVPDVSGDISYDLIMLDTTGGSEKVTPIINNYPADVVGWHVVPVGQLYIPADSTVSIILQKTTTSQASVFSGQWMSWDKPEPQPVGQFSAVNGHVYVSQTDNDLVDRKTDLDSLVPGSTIDTGGTLWEIQSIAFTPGAGAADGTYDFTVTPSVTLPKDKLTTLQFVNYNAYNMPLWSVPDFYLADPNVRGFVRRDDGVVAYDENAYTVDIQYQRVTKSPDWDIMKASDIVPPQGGTLSSSQFNVTPSPTPGLLANLIVADDPPNAATAPDGLLWLSRKDGNAKLRVMESMSWNGFGHCDLLGSLSQLALAPGTHEYYFGDKPYESLEIVGWFIPRTIDGSLQIGFEDGGIYRDLVPVGYQTAIIKNGQTAMHNGAIVGSGLNPIYLTDQEHPVYWALANQPCKFRIQIHNADQQAASFMFEASGVSPLVAGPTPPGTLNAQIWQTSGLIGNNDPLERIRLTLTANSDVRFNVKGWTYS